MEVALADRLDTTPQNARTIVKSHLMADVPYFTHRHKPATFNPSASSASDVRVVYIALANQSGLSEKLSDIADIGPRLDCLAKLGYWGTKLIVHDSSNPYGGKTYFRGMITERSGETLLDVDRHVLFV